MNIDIHSHILPENCFNLVDSRGRRYGPQMVPNANGTKSLILEGMNLPGSLRTRSLEARIADMDAQGIDIQVLSPLPLMFYYEAEAEVGAWLSRQQNEGVAKVVREYPTRFIGLGTVPLQDPPKAVAELDYAVGELRIKGVQITTHVNGAGLDQPELWPFYRRVQELDVPIFLHPFRVAGAERLQGFHLENLIGNLLETTIAATRLIFGGVLEKFPGLHFCLAHAGGNLPYMRGRLEHGYKVRPECRKAIPQPPSYYLSQFYFDTITHFAPALQYLVSSVGADRVMLGSDYPADMADPAPVSTVKNLSGITPQDKDKILGGNAARLFKLG